MNRVNLLAYAIPSHELASSCGMDTLLFLILSVTLIALCLGALWFYGYAIYGAIDYLIQADTTLDPDFHPRVTVLKPLCGLDADTHSNLLSFCQQDYPHYQIVFAVQDAADPCIAIVEKLIQRFPERQIRLVVSNQRIGINPKVNNLANAVAEAKHDLWVIADSDIRVEPNYLRQIVQPFRYPGVGVVTCPYRSRAAGWIATLEALGTAAELHPGVLVARCREGVHFALGSTIVIRKELLTKLGGFKAIADYLADDFQLGRLPASLGYRVVLSGHVVEHGLATDSLWQALQRQIRWARGVRVSRPWGYVGKIITYGTVTSLLLLWVLGGSGLGWTILGMTWLARLAMGWIVGVGCLNDRSTQCYWWLLPIYDLISFGVWCCGLVGKTIEWRGQQFRLLPGGKLQAISETQQSLPIKPVLKVNVRI